MIGRLLVGFVWLNLQSSVSWQVDIQWVSCGSIFSFLCHGWQIFSGVRVVQSLIFCVMVDRLLVGFVWFNLQFSVSWQVDFQWGSCGSIFCFLFHGRQTFSGIRVANLQISVSWLVDFQWGSCGSIFSLLCHGRQTFSGFRVAQSLDFCVMVGRLLVGFVWLNLLFSVSRFPTFSGVRVAQSLVFCVMVGRLLAGFVWLNLQFSSSWFAYFQGGSCVSIFSFLRHGWETFSGVRVAQTLIFCVMVGRLSVGFVWLNLQFSASWLVDLQWGSRGSIFSFLGQGRRLSVGFVWLNLYFSVSWMVDFQWVRVAQSFVFCVMIGGLLVGFVWLNLLFSVSWLVDFQWASCVLIFSFLCHGWQTFSGLRVSQSFVFCVMVGIPLVGFVWLNLLFSVSWLGDFQWGSCVSIQFSVSWLVDFQWDSYGSIFSYLCHGRQTFSGVRVAQYLVFCVMVGRILVGFVWLNLQFSVSWQVDFQWGSCGSIFSLLCHERQTFSGVRVSQSLVFCVMIGRLLVGFVWLNLQFSVSWQVDFQWDSCCSIFSLLCHDRQTFRGFRVAQSLDFCVMVGRLSVGFVCLNLVFCVMVGRLLVGFVWLNLQFSVSWQVDFQWGSCGSIFCFLCHGWQNFSGVRVAQSLVFCVMVGRLLVGFVWLNLQSSVS